MFLGPLNTALPTLPPVELFCEGSHRRDEYWGRLLTRPQFVLPTRTLSMCSLFRGYIRSIPEVLGWVLNWLKLNARGALPFGSAVFHE
jgi:hypothetical protein